MRTMCVTTSLCALLALAPAPAAPAAPGAAQTPESPSAGEFKAVIIAGYFACEIPSGWTLEESARPGPPPRRTVFGIRARGPQWGPVPVKLAVLYYPEDGVQYLSAEHYIETFSRPALGGAREGERYDAVRRITVAGRNAVAFGRLKNEFLPAPGLDEGPRDDGKIYERGEKMAEPYAVEESFVVVLAAGGFYALTYSAPAEHFQRLRAAFERVLASFDPLR